MAVAIALCLLLDLTYSFGTACPHPPQPSGDKQQVAGDNSQEPCSFRQSIGGRFITWVGDRIDADETPLTTIAAWVLASITLILAAYTALLWGATGKLVRGADNTARRQLRAYPGVTGAHIVLTRNRVEIAVEIENFSTTPAYKFRHAISQQLCTPEQPLTNFGRIHKDMQWDMAPHSKTTLRSNEDVGEAKVLALRQGDLLLFFGGRVDYEDAFGAPRYIEFVYRQGAFAPRIIMGDGLGGLPEQRTVHICSEPEPIRYESN